ncbi:hypothetical protein GCM10014719_59160 [Planomonospora parontospora subsp. antibiotica]|nr:hypothetical protein GCM10014719_59160 [Planomonospora parontospora subsp. antibiotica]GII19258.1 hypothetical protein Ppa05_59840 [Planomonospora parontospora subsp. antibiotica]
MPVTGGLVVLLAATMLTIGTGLTREAFTRLVRRPGALAAALIVNVVVIPAVALLIVTVLGLQGPIGYGIVLAAAAPGGGTGALLAAHARGDLALAVGLQGALAVLGLAAVPAWSALTSYGGAPAATTGGPQVLGMLAGQLIPLALGMALRSRHPTAADRAAAISRRIADVLLVAMVAYLLATTADELSALPVTAFAAFTALTTVCLAAYATPGLPDRPARRTVAMTTAVRNLSLALLIANLTTHPAEVGLTVLAYGLVMYAACGLALVAFRAVDRRLVSIT